MFRYLIAAGAIASCIFPLRAGAQAPVESLSTVYFARDDRVMNRLEESAEISRAMVDSLVMAATGQTGLAGAWRTLVSPGDRVGIKIATAGGRYFSSHRGIVTAIVAGLEAAGVPRERIILWDRNTEDLRAAGYLPHNDRYEVRAIDPPRGFDRDAPIAAPMLGKLMWGDLLFAEKQQVPFGKQKSDSDQLSSTSHLARIVSREITKFINVPVLSDERGCGVAGAIYNATIPNIDNWRRFTKTEGSITASPAEIYADARVGSKCVLHILDGLLAQYAGGPAFNPQYSFAHQTIYVSRDPVALDATVLRQLDTWRLSAKLPSIANRGRWLEDAAAMGLGNAAQSRISLQQVELPR